MTNFCSLFSPRSLPPGVCVLQWLTTMLLFQFAQPPALPLRVALTVEKKIQYKHCVLKQFVQLHVRDNKRKTKIEIRGKKKKTPPPPPPHTPREWILAILFPHLFFFYGLFEKTISLKNLR